tara:strand:+ start:2347 stop:2952 length:606 start_codon:yes stop_codon:yes gene_type:complete
MKTILLGLTGSIGMGKSTATGYFKYLGTPVFDSDLVVRRLTKKNNQIYNFVETYFPYSIDNGVINKKILGNELFKDQQKLEMLEDIIHPLVRQKRDVFTALAKKRREPLIVFDIPLLFEKGSENIFDYVAVVTAPKFVQKERVLRRKGMSIKKFNLILENQMPDKVKRKKADFLIFSSLGRAESLKKIKYIRSFLLKIAYK